MADNAATATLTARLQQVTADKMAKFNDFRAGKTLWYALHVPYSTISSQTAFVCLFLWV
jgi:hypothetical protein